MTPHVRLRALSFALAFGSATVSLAIGSLMVGSHVPFQVNQRATDTVASTLGLNHNGWLEVDLLGAQCGCSHRVAQHLISRGRVEGIDERVIIVGDDPEMSSWFAAKRWQVRTLRMDEAAAIFGTHGAPFLVLIDGDGRVRYAGGYSPDRFTQSDFREQTIWRAVKSGGTVEPFPVFGCAVERSIQKRIDPLGLKYGWLAGRGGV